MAKPAELAAVLDANVLYPAPIRDILLNLADIKLYRPKWSAQIQDEWGRNLLKNRPDIAASSIESAQSAMDSAFPDANVTAHELLIDDLELPDVDDRHVLAAAIKSGAKIIVTNNLKDFPSRRLKQYHIEAQTPDKFITDLAEIDDFRLLQAFQAQVKRLKNPPQSVNQVLAALEKNGLKRTVKILKSLLIS